MKWNPKPQKRTNVEIITAIVKDQGTTRAKVREMMGEMIKRDAPRAEINPKK